MGEAIITRGGGGGSKLDQIGDIKTTVRTDLGEDWLLCNGAPISAEEYPELFPKLQSDLGGNWYSFACPSAGLHSLTYANGYWVGITNNGELYYKAGLPSDGAWTLVTLSGTLRSVVYGNGYWVAGGYSGVLWYCQNETPDGVWVQNTHHNSTYKFESLIFANDYFVAVGVQQIHSTWRTPTGTWASTPLSNPTTAYKIAYGGGYWVVSGNTRFWTRVGSSPTGSYTSTSQDFTASGSLIYGGGYWVSVLSGYCVYAPAGSPNSAWTKKALGSPSYSAGLYDEESGRWIFTGSHGTIRVISDIPTWSGFDVPQENTTTGIGSMAKGDGLFLAIQGSNFLLGGKRLPLISPDRAYAYIKAK